jgi:enoyl-CoA hydratase/carnithine racemase
MRPVLGRERIGRVQVATLSRPPVNALDGELVERLDELLTEVSADPEVSVLHIRSDQKTFCAGADLTLMRSRLETRDGIDAMVEQVRRLQLLFARMEAAPVVTLAEIGGAALGGGLELALACDLRVAATDAKLGLPEVSLGVVPGAGGTQRLTRLCGSGIAKRLILGAEVIDGAQAEPLAIVQWVLPRERLAEWTRKLAARIAEMPRGALAASKRCVHAAGDAKRDGLAEELAATRELYGQAQTRAKVTEFLSRKFNGARTKEMP